MINKLALSLFFLLTAAAALPAQSDSLPVLSRQEAYRRNSWLAGSNPAGLVFNRFPSFSIAEAGYQYSKGNLGNPGYPASAQIYNMYAESFLAFGKACLYGQLGYRNEQKRNINWQHGVENRWHGTTLCDSVSGNRQSEQYRLAGAFSLPVRRAWSIGARFDYLAELATKDTDPRHKKQQMEWKLTSGIGYRKAQLRLGASFGYGNRKETVDYQNVGAHSAYPCLIAYPLAFYKTLSAGQKISWYYSQQAIESAIQAQALHGPISIFQEIAGSFARQDVLSNRMLDKKESETAVWRIGYQIKLRKTSARGRHAWNGRLTWCGATNYEPLQQQEGTDIWSTRGKVLRSALRTSEYALSYSYDRLRGDGYPARSFFTGIRLHRQKNSLFFYPEKYMQPVHACTLYASFTYNFLFPQGLLDCTLGGKYRKGGGHLLEEKRLRPDQNAPAIALWQNRERLQQTFDYETAPRWDIRLTVTYTHPAPFRWFIRITGKYEKAYYMITDKNRTFFSTQTGILF